MRRKRCMKKYLTIVLLVLLCGCGDNGLQENLNKEWDKIQSIKITYPVNGVEKEVFIKIEKNYEIKDYKDNLVIWKTISPKPGQIIKNKIYSINGTYQIEYNYLDSITFISHNREQMIVNFLGNSKYAYIKRQCFPNSNISSYILLKSNIELNPGDKLTDKIFHAVFLDISDKDFSELTTNKTYYKYFN